MREQLWISHFKKIRQTERRMFLVGQQLERKDLCILNVKMNSVKREKLKFLKREGSLKGKVLAA